MKRNWSFLGFWAIWAVCQPRPKVSQKCDRIGVESSCATGGGSRSIFCAEFRLLVKSEFWSSKVDRMGPNTSKTDKMRPKSCVWAHPVHFWWPKLTFDQQTRISAKNWPQTIYWPKSWFRAFPVAPETDLCHWLPASSEGSKPQKWPFTFYFRFDWNLFCRGKSSWISDLEPRENLKIIKNAFADTKPGKVNFGPKSEFGHFCDLAEAPPRSCVIRLRWNFSEGLSLP